MTPFCRIFSTLDTKKSRGHRGGKGLVKEAFTRRCDQLGYSYRLTVDCLYAPIFKYSAAFKGLTHHQVHSVGQDLRTATMTRSRLLVGTDSFRQIKYENTIKYVETIHVLRRLKNPPPFPENEPEKRVLHPSGLTNQPSRWLLTCPMHDLPADWPWTAAPDWCNCRTSVVQQ